MARGEHLQPEAFCRFSWLGEISPGRRIVNACTVSMDGKPMADALPIIELYGDGKGGCRFIYTEQGAYYGDDNDIRNRRAGCDELFGKL